MVNFVRRELGKHVVINRECGFLDFHMFGFMLLIVWGFCGNCYHGRRKVLRFDFGADKGVHRCLIQFQHGTSYITDSLYVYRWLQPWRWNFNSEWIARRWGRHSEGSGYAPETYRYQGILGDHIWL